MISWKIFGNIWELRQLILQFFLNSQRYYVHFDCILPVKQILQNEGRKGAFVFFTQYKPIVERVIGTDVNFVVCSRQSVVNWEEILSVAYRQIITIYWFQLIQLSAWKVAIWKQSSSQTRHLTSVLLNWFQMAALFFKNWVSNQLSWIKRSKCVKSFNYTVSFCTWDALSFQQ